MQEQIYENPHDKASEVLENHAQEGRTQRIALEMYAHKPYTQEYRRLMLGAQGLLFLGNVFSVGTVFAAIGIATLPAVAAYTGGVVAYGLGGVVVLCVALTAEAVKVESAKAVAKNRLRYKKTAKMALALWLFFGSTSIVASCYGAKQLPQQVSTPPVWDASAYDQREAKLQAEVAAIRGSAQWKGIVTKDGNKQIASVQAQQKALSEERAAARSEYEARRTAHAEKVLDYENIAFWVALVVEMIIVVCSTYIAYYYYRAFLEWEAKNSKDEPEDTFHRPRLSPVNVPKSPRLIAPPQPAESPDAGQPAPPDSLQQERPKIGFRYGENLANAPQTHSEQPAKHTNPHLRHCEHCGAQYIYNHKKQRFCSVVCRVAYNKEKKGGTV